MIREDTCFKAYSSIYYFSRHLVEDFGLTDEEKVELFKNIKIDEMMALSRLTSVMSNRLYIIQRKR